MSIFLASEELQEFWDALLDSLKTITDLHPLGRIGLIKCQNISVGLDSFFNISDGDSSYIFILYIQQLCANTGCSLEDLAGVTDDRDEWQEKVREICVSGVTRWWWHIYIYIYIYTETENERLTFLLIIWILYSVSSGWPFGYLLFMQFITLKWFYILSQIFYQFSTRVSVVRNTLTIFHLPL